MDLAGSVLDGAVGFKAPLGRNVTFVTPPLGVTVKEPVVAKDIVEGIEDPFIRRALRVSVHFRSYLPFYVFSLIWALMLVMVPTIRGGSDDGGTIAGSVVDTGGRSTSATVRTGGTGDVASSDGPGTTSGNVRARQSSDGGPVEAAAGDLAAPPPPNIAESVQVSQQTGGLTRDGRECQEGVRQIPISSYATQCVNAWPGGDNGGATYRGVDAEKIRVVRRNFPDSPNSQAADQINAQAGFASDDVAEMVRDKFIEYFNATYELYGRTVEWVDYESQNGDSTAEAQSQGREGACADATQIVKELGAFAVSGGSGPFGYCAAEKDMLVFRAGAYFPESLYYQDNHPYLWHTLMECERISYQVGEYVGKRLLNRPAKWAGDPLMQAQDRKFGTYVPDNDEYQHCVRISEEVLERDYGGTITSRYDYQLDLARFPDQAQTGIVQFKAAGVTTVINACDPYSTIFLTQAAESQNYYPEWYIIGVAAQDTDNLARLYIPNQVDGHLFGMSQLGATTKLIGPDSEPGRVYQAITGEEIPEGTTGGYFDLVQMYNFMQSAGPILTPQAIAAGVMTIPPGGAPDYPGGYWSYQDGSDGTPGTGDHTAIDDGREIYWDGSATGPDGDAGTYIETYGGRRFRNGEWPAEEPPVYPGG